MVHEKQDGRERGGGAGGVNSSLYLSNRADEILDNIAAATKRSRSEVASLLFETFGPEVINDPSKLLS